jgi:glutathione S-transferase
MNDRFDRLSERARIMLTEAEIEYETIDAEVIFDIFEKASEYPY